MAENVADQMAAVRIPGIGMGDSLANLATALDQDQRSVKVVFTDYQSEAGPCGQSPAEIKALLLLAVQLVKKRCSELGHKDYPCELIFFKPLKTPANYVTAGEPVNISPGNNHTT